MFSKLLRRVTAPRVHSGPANKRLYAIGDVHGRLDLLDELLAMIDRDLAESPVETAATVFLGDLIDRGPDSAGVVERLRAIPDRPERRLLFLLGNHEEMLLRSVRGEAGIAHDWLRFGGDACADSYGLSPTLLGALPDERVAAMLGQAIPPEHLAFLERGADSFRFGDYLLVHAGIRPGVAIEEQTPHDLRWIRRPFLVDDHDHGVMVIHGHTITDGVDRRHNRIGIDTGAYRSGVLTACVVEGESLRFLATGG